MKTVLHENFTRDEVREVAVTDRQTDGRTNAGGNYDIVAQNYLRFSRAVIIVLHLKPFW